MKYGIIVDSGCDLKYLEGAEENNILFKRVPLSLIIGDKVFIDDLDLDVKKAIKEIQDYEGKSSSAAPSPQAWADAFKEADEVFAITITSALSGTYNSALIGKDLCLEDYPDKKIHVFNSLSASAEMILIANKIRNLIIEQNSFEEIVSKTEAYMKTTDLLVSLGSLDTFIKNGRVKKSLGRLAGALNIKFLIELKKGQLEVLKKCRGRHSVYDKMIKRMIEKNYCGGEVYISHCNNEEDAIYLKNQILKYYKTAIITIHTTTALCSYYAEDKGIIMGYETN